jgi:hypothetical protein
VTAAGCSACAASLTSRPERRIIHGLDVLEAMENMKVDGKDRPVHEIKIVSVKIHSNPLADNDNA